MYADKNIKISSLKKPWPRIDPIASQFVRSLTTSPDKNKGQRAAQISTDERTKTKILFEGPVQEG